MTSLSSLIQSLALRLEAAPLSFARQIKAETKEVCQSGSSPDGLPDGLPDSMAKPLTKSVTRPRRSPEKPPSPFVKRKRTNAAASASSPAGPVQTGTDGPLGAPAMLSRLSIPCPDPTREERVRDTHQKTALHLVRQEKWSELSVLVARADDDRSMTPGGMSVAELMAFGARSDVVLAVEHALLENEPGHDAPLLRGITSLEYVLAEHPGDPVIACIVAQAHMDLGWAWRGIGWDVEIARRNREAFDAHFARAQDILRPFNTEQTTSPLLANTACSLLSADCSSAETVANCYEKLIDLNPRDMAPLRALGTRMLPRRHGSYPGLELEARRTAARTEAVWGAGGYTWVMFDAISIDDEACARLDLPFFIEGLHDILSRRTDPHTVNLLAAYCANTMGQAFSGNDAADQNRAHIAGIADAIVREHLTELHPMIWAHAAQGFANNLRVSSASRFAAAGQDDALRIIAGLFRHEIEQGKRIVFTDEGPVARAI